VEFEPVVLRRKGRGEACDKNLIAIPTVSQELAVDGTGESCFTAPLPQPRQARGTGIQISQPVVLWLGLRSRNSKCLRAKIGDLMRARICIPQAMLFSLRSQFREPIIPSIGIADTAPVGGTIIKRNDRKSGRRLAAKLLTIPIATAPSGANDVG
jgi:hypothetical protein